MNTLDFMEQRLFEMEDSKDFRDVFGYPKLQPIVVEQGKIVEQRMPKPRALVLAEIVELSLDEIATLPKDKAYRGFKITYNVIKKGRRKESVESFVLILSDDLINAKINRSE